MMAFLTDGWTDQAISAANAVFAWVACCAHIYAASKTSGNVRKMFMLIGTLALFYSFAYWWLFFNPERIVEWSNFLRPFGVFTWVVAWAVEPVVMVHYLTSTGRKIEHRARVVAEDRSQRLDEIERRSST